jgi:hypothetical protein
VVALLGDLEFDARMVVYQSKIEYHDLQNTSTFCSILGVIRENICRHMVSPCDKTIFRLNGNKATVARMGVMASR